MIWHLKNVEEYIMTSAFSLCLNIPITLPYQEANILFISYLKIILPNICRNLKGHVDVLFVLRLIWLSFPCMLLLSWEMLSMEHNCAKSWYSVCKMEIVILKTLPSCGELTKQNRLKGSSTVSVTEYSLNKY